MSLITHALGRQEQNKTENNVKSVFVGVVLLSRKVA